MIRYFDKEAHDLAFDACSSELLKYGMPAALVPGVARYCIDHIETGQFLRAVLENDLLGAFRRADPESLMHMQNILDALLMVAPSPCWGSNQAVEGWLKEGVTDD